MSDAHLGRPEHAPSETLVLEPFLRDLEAAAAEFGFPKPHLVVFSGDVAFGNTDLSTLGDQYATARRFLRRVCETVGSSLEEQLILVVPGNHDIDRSEVLDASTTWLSARERDPDKLHKAMIDNSADWKEIMRRQNQWRRFVRELPTCESWEFDETLNLTTGIIEHDGHSVGIAGLNTSWAARGGAGENGHIWFGMPQLRRARANIESADFRIAVGHHPPTWVPEVESPAVDNFLRRRFNVYMHGHEHVDWYTDSKQHLRVAAGALYERADKPSFYSWITLDFDGRKAAIAPRTYDEDRGERWHAVLDDRTDNGPQKGLATLEFPDREAPTASGDTTPPRDETPPIHLEEELVATKERMPQATWFPVSSGTVKAILTTGPNGPRALSPVASGFEDATGPSLALSACGRVAAQLMRGSLMISWVVGTHPTPDLTRWDPVRIRVDLSARLLAIDHRAAGMEVAVLISTDADTLLTRVSRDGTVLSQTVVRERAAEDAVFVDNDPWIVDQDGGVGSSPAARILSGMGPVVTVDAARIAGSTYIASVVGDGERPFLQVVSRDGDRCARWEAPDTRVVRLPRQFRGPGKFPSEVMTSPTTALEIPWE